MPPRAKRSKSPGARFLFVNEDAATVNRTSKDAELDRTKQSHVQRQNFARKRRLQEQSGPTAQESNTNSVSGSPSEVGTSAQVNQVGLDEGVDYFTFLQNIDPGDPLLQSTSPLSISPSPLNQNLSGLFSDLFSATPVSPSSLTPTTGLYSYRQGNYPDIRSTSFGPARPNSGSVSFATSSSSGGTSAPASRTQRALEQWAPPLIRYYSTVVLPERFWRDTQKVPLGQIRHAPYIHADMQACMSKPAHMYSFLTSTAAQMLEREGKLLLPNTTEEDNSRIPSFFRNKAIQAVRAELMTGQLDHRLAMNIGRLYVASIYQDDLDGAEPHFQAMLSMIESLGGMDTFDVYQTEQFFMLDCTTALKQQGFPRFAPARDPGSCPVDDLVHHNPLASRFPPGSLLETAAEIFGECAITSDHTMDLLELARFAECLHNETQYNPEHYKWLNWKSLLISHRLLSLPLHRDLTSKADCARIATAYWVALLRSPVIGRRAASCSSAILRSRLEETDLDTLWQPRTDCLLWISVMGGICCTTDSDDRDWFVLLARTAVIELAVSNASELEDLMTGFLYDVLSMEALVTEFAGFIWPREDL